MSSDNQTNYTGSVRRQSMFRTDNQLFSNVAVYNGVIVSVKRLQQERVSITRDQLLQLREVGGYVMIRIS